MRRGRVEGGNGLLGRESPNLCRRGVSSGHIALLKRGRQGWLGFVDLVDDVLWGSGWGSVFGHVDVYTVGPGRLLVRTRNAGRSAQDVLSGSITFSDETGAFNTDRMSDHL
jgi:hypothetical protein